MCTRVACTVSLSKTRKWLSPVWPKAAWNTGMAMTQEWLSTDPQHQLLCDHAGRHTGSIKHMDTPSGQTPCRDMKNMPSLRHEHNTGKIGCTYKSDHYCISKEILTPLDRAPASAAVCTFLNTLDILMLSAGILVSCCSANISALFCSPSLFGLALLLFVN